MFDLQTHEFKEKIIKDINDCGLPLSMINYILLDVTDLVKRSLEVEIQKQKHDRVTQEQQEEQQLFHEEIVEIDVSGD